MAKTVVMSRLAPVSGAITDSLLARMYQLWFNELTVYTLNGTYYLEQRALIT